MLLDSINLIISRTRETNNANNALIRSRPQLPPSFAPQKHACDCATNRQAYVVLRTRTIVDEKHNVRDRATADIHVEHRHQR